MPTVARQGGAFGKYSPDLVKCIKVAKVSMEYVGLDAML